MRLWLGFQYTHGLQPNMFTEIDGQFDSRIPASRYGQQFSLIAIFTITTSDSSWVNKISNIFHVYSNVTVEWRKYKMMIISIGKLDHIKD